MKIACLVTGAPRTFTYCLDSLKFYLMNHDVDFFLVYRDDNSDPETCSKLLSAYKPRLHRITTAADTYELECNSGTHQMLTRMWHEVGVGRDLISPIAHEYDLFMRVRYDMFFGPSFVETDLNEGACILPRTYEFLGNNDMYFLSRWPEFVKYASTINYLPGIISRLGGSYTPELIVADSLRYTGVRTDVRDIIVGLHRPWFKSATSQEFAQIVMRYPRDLLMKYEQAARDQEAAERKAAELVDQVKLEALFPVGSNAAFHWYGVELDARDNLPFRFFSSQAALWRAIPLTVTRFRFIVPYKARSAPIEKFCVFFDGQYVPLNLSQDNFGRYVVEGIVPLESKGRAPLSKISLLFNYTVIPSAEGSNLKDNRLLSLAISDIEFT